MTASAAAAAALAFSLSITPFGAISEKLAKEDPWRGFQADGPNLLVIRAEHVADADCAAWSRALAQDTRGVSFANLGANPEKNDAWPSALKQGWEPFTENDLDAINDCTDFPCDVKLNEAEAKEMAAVPKEARLAKYFDLVRRRAQAYLKSGQRHEYEFPGDPVDPWKRFSEIGFKTHLAMPAKPRLWVRKINLDPKRMKTVHEVLDFRSALESRGRGAALWVRDAYTDHYFDGWGEIAEIVCDPGPRGVTWAHALFIELDLMKKGDLFSRLARGKMRSVIESNGQEYLDHAFARVQQKTRKENSP